MGNEKRRRAANVLIGSLGQAGFTELNMTELSGAFMVDFMVPPTQEWEHPNMKSSIHITKDGEVAAVQIRPPGAHERMGHIVRQAARAAANAPSRPSDWSFHLDQRDGFGDKIDHVRPHINKDGIYTEYAEPAGIAKDIKRAVEAYRRVTSQHR